MRPPKRPTYGQGRFWWSRRSVAITVAPLAMVSLVLGVAVGSSASGGGALRGLYSVDVSTGGAVRVPESGWLLTDRSSPYVVLWTAPERHDEVGNVTTLSRDGRRVVFRANVSTSANPEDAIALHGRRVSYVSHDGSNHRGPKRGILVVQHLDGTHKRTVARKVTGTPVFSPDGTEIVVPRVEESRPLIVNAATGRSRVARTPILVRAWLPDGRFVGEMRRENPGGSLEPRNRLVVVRDGATPRTLIEQYAFGPLVLIDPRGRRAAVPTIPSPDGGTSSTLILPLDRPGKATSIDAYGAIAWRRDGQRLAGTSGLDVLLWIVDPAGPRRELVRKSNDTVAGQVAWTPDSRHVLVYFAKTPPPD